jgi:hypothetical protein
MFGHEYLTIGGYIMDGYALCADCGEAQGISHEYSCSIADLEASFSDGGLTCDSCMAEIVEPYVEETDEEDEEDNAGFDSAEERIKAEASFDAYLRTPLAPAFTPLALTPGFKHETIDREGFEQFLRTMGGLFEDSRKHGRGMNRVLSTEELLALEVRFSNLRSERSK